MQQNLTLHHIQIKEFTTHSDFLMQNFELSYQIFGDASALNNNGVMVFHALTGNSNVTGTDGWWNDLVGNGKLIDTNKHPVIAINILGNGFSKSDTLITNFEQFNARDIAKLFNLVLEYLAVTKLHAAIGGSLGGGVAWELVALCPELFDNLIAIGSHYQSSDWVIGHNYVQLQILKNSKNPLETARMMAMLFYRSPQSLKQKFNRTKNLEKDIFNVESYLAYQGQKLTQRFKLESYQLMNHLLSNIDILADRDMDVLFKSIKTKITMVGIVPDLLFSSLDNIEALPLLKKNGIKAEYRELHSIHGHDAFLIEYDKMNELLADLF